MAGVRGIDEEIVELMKQQMGISFTLFQFSDIKGKDLVELLNRVVHQVDETQPERLGIERIEQTTDRISEFLRVLKYPFPVEPEEWDVRFGKGDEQLLYPAILYLLKDLPDMQKRAYLARYTEEVPVPAEIRVDQDVGQLCEELKELQEQFLVAHKESTDLGTMNVQQLRTDIQDLEGDKARLASKIQGAKRKVGNPRNLEDMLKAVAKVRQENEGEAKLADQIRRLQEERRNLEHKQTAAKERVRNMKANMEGRVRQLRADIEALKSARVPVDASGEEKSLVFSQQQVIAQTKRLEQKQKQLQDLREARAAKEQELAVKQQSAPVEIPGPTQFGQYVKALKQKNESYREMKGVLEAEKKELAGLMRAAEIVREQAQAIEVEISSKERAAGVGAFRRTRRQLEEVSAQKAELDDLKGKSLEEMSQIVEMIQRQAQARQAELRPLVAALQEQRKLASAVESKYLTAKQRYQNARQEYEAASVEMREECRKLRADIDEHQSKYHKITQQLGLIERGLARAVAEKKATETGNPVSKAIQTYADFFHRATRQMKGRAKELKEQRKQVGDRNDANAKQLEGFQALRRLLEKKKESLARQIEARAEQADREKAEALEPGENLVFDDAMGPGRRKPGGPK